MTSDSPNLPEHLSAGAEFGEFRLIRELGRGGMAVVFEAQELGLRRRVALKIFHPRFDQTVVDTHRFQREAEAASRLQHPAVARVFSRGVHQGIPFIASELVPDGQNMDELCQFWQKDSANIPEDHVRLVATWFSRVADAISEAHSKGILHRDLKPANLIVSGAGQAFVVDFGLAWMEDRPGLSQSGEMVGTPFFMCPEQVASGAISHSEKSDIYSLGASLYQMLTLQRPFEAAQAEQVFQRILHEDPAHPKKIRPQLPEDLVRVCLKAMERAPGHRYASIQEFSDDLQRFLHHEPVHAQSPNFVRRMRKWQERHPARFVAGLLFAVMIGILVRGSLMLQGRDLALQRAESAWSDSRYGTLMGAADQAIQGFRFEDAADLLNLCEVPLRDWTWRHANRKLNRHLTTLRPPGGPRLLAAAIHPQAKFVVGGFSDGALSIWNPFNGELVKEVLGFEHGVYAVAFSPDGHFVAAAGDDMLVHVLETENFENVGIYDGHFAGIGGVAFSHHSNWIVSCDDAGEVHIWDLNNHELLAKGQVPPRAVVVAISDDDSCIAVADGHGGVQILEPKTGIEMMPGLNGHTELVYDLCFLPGELTLLSGSADRKMLRWDLSTGSPVVTGEIVSASPINTVFPMAGHQEFALGTKDGKVTMIHLVGQPAGEILEQWEAHFTFTNVVRVSNVGGFLLTGGDDGALHTWKLAPEPIRVLEQRKNNLAKLAAFNDRGDLATISVSGELQIWDCAKVQPSVVQHFVDRVPVEIALSASGETVAVRFLKGEVELISTQKENRRSFALQPITRQSALAFQPGKEGVLVLGEQGKGQLLQLELEWAKDLQVKIHSVLQSSDATKQLLWAPDGLLWVIRQASVDVFQTNVVGWPLLRSYALDHPLLGVVRTNGDVAIASQQGVHLFQAEPGHAPAIEDVFLVEIETRGLRSLALHPQEGCMAGGFEDGQIRIWQQSTGAVCTSFSAHSDAIQHLQFFPGGDWLMSAAENGDLEFWGTDDSSWPIR